MPLQLAPLKTEDFITMQTYIYHHGGDLIAPIMPLVWEVAANDTANAAARNAWSIDQQREIFEGDPTAHFMKVHDSDKGEEVVSLARWHYYPHGCNLAEMRPWELNAPKASPWPKGLNREVYVGLLEPLLASRPEWMGRRPMWVLTTLITKESQRRRGAGGMLVQWGVEQAKKDKVPAFLEASTEGAPLYEKYGFKVVGEQTVDLSQWGVPEPVTLTRMAFHEA